MNVYILTEITKRELDSNLLLSVIGASRGHDIFISNMTNFEYLANKRLLKPGIFHTKSLVHDKLKKLFHIRLKELGIKITSLDEENGLVRKDLTPFVEQRFSINDLKIADKIFCWGPHDLSCLRKKYPKHIRKFYLSGSPRAEMWKKNFLSYWTRKKKIEKKNVLISLNFAVINGFETERKIFKKYEKTGYFNRSKGAKKELKQFIIESKQNIKAFVDLINYLTIQMPDLNFIVRPHPREDLSFWNRNIKKRENLIIRNSGNFNEELASSKMVIHNSSTTAFQAAVNKIPIISYVPYKSKLTYGDLANRLGIICKNKLTVKKIISKTIKNKYKFNNVLISKIIKFKLKNLKKSPSSEIVKYWEKLSKKINYKENYYTKIKLYLYLMNILVFLKKFIYSLIKLKNFYYIDNKFENMHLETIKDKIELLKKINNIKCDFKTTITSGKFLLIKKLN